MTRRPRLAFVGLGWIGRLRLDDLVRRDVADVAALIDPSEDCLEAARFFAPEAVPFDSFAAWLERAADGLDVDGLVVATPSALHAAQAEAALARGLAVFCQKPLGRDAAEALRVVEHARRADRLLDVDLCYRETTALRRVRELVVAGDIGRVYAVDLVFHNAFGPGQSWWRDHELAGGGCVIDLATHLVDAAGWILGWPRVRRVESRLFAGGRRLPAGSVEIEDYGSAELDLEDGTIVRLACSWDLPAGCDAVISGEFHGVSGGASWRNVDGSFYDFVADHHRGTKSIRLAEPPDDWGGRRLAGFVERLARDSSFDPRAFEHVEVARVLDRIYGKCDAAPARRGDAAHA